MSAIRRFIDSDFDSSIFEIEIDTTLGNGNKTFELPITNAVSSIDAILQVSDGRPDIRITLANRDTAKFLTFANHGIYTIRLIGVIPNLGSRATTDCKPKIIYLNRFGSRILLYYEAFLDCVNMTVRATDIPRLRGNSINMFRRIKGFDPIVDLTTWDLSNVTSYDYIIGNMTNAPTSVPQGFLYSTVCEYMYAGSKLENIAKIEIISNTLTTANLMFYQSNFRGRLIMRTPNLTNISGLVFGYANVPSLGEVDIRNVTIGGSYNMGSSMTTANVDATLLGWVNNFDWSSIPAVANKFTFPFAPNSKYSNNPSVIAAKLFLEAKGIVFTNLTMV